MKKVAVLLALLLALPGCAGAEDALQQGMDLRQALLSCEGCGFDADITADYGQELQRFSMSCQADGQGNMTFTVTAPESIAGITGKLSGDGGQWTFDDTALSFPLLADGQLSPVSAPWVLLSTLRGGCLTSAGREGEEVRLSIDHRYDDDAMRLDIWLDQGNLPCRGEIVWDGRSVLSLRVGNFTIS